MVLGRPWRSDCQCQLRNTSDGPTVTVRSHCTRCTQSRHHDAVTVRQ